MAKIAPEKIITSGESKKGKYVSKGERPNVSRWLTKVMKNERSPLDVVMNKLAAWKKGHTPKGFEANQSFGDGHVSAHWSRKKWPDHDKANKDAKMPADRNPKEEVVEANG